MRWQTKSPPPMCLQSLHSAGVQIFLSPSSRRFWNLSVSITVYLLYLHSTCFAQEIKSSRRRARILIFSSDMLCSSYAERCQCCHFLCQLRVPCAAPVPPMSPHAGCEPPHPGFSPRSPRRSSPPARPDRQSTPYPVSPPPRQILSHILRIFVS